MNRNSRLAKLEQIRETRDDRPAQIQYINVIKDQGDGTIEVEEWELGNPGGYKIVYRGTREGYNEIQ